MQAHRDIFRGNIELHLMLEQFIYGKLNCKQIAEVRKQFNEKLHKHPQQFHELVASVRESCAADESPSADNEPLDLHKVQDVCQQLELDNISRQLDDMRIHPDDQKDEAQCTDLAEKIEQQKQELVVDMENAQALIMPDQNDVRVEKGMDNMKQKTEQDEQLLNGEQKLMAIKFEPHMEYLQKSIVLTDKEIVHKMPVTNEKAETSQSTTRIGGREAIKQQIKDLRDRIRSGQEQMNKMIAQQQKDLKALAELESKLRVE